MDRVCRVAGVLADPGAPTGMLGRLPPAVGTPSTYWLAPELLGGITVNVLALAAAGSSPAIRTASRPALVCVALTDTYTRDRHQS
jgi:hypothetical protein